MCSQVSMTSLERRNERVRYFAVVRETDILKRAELGKALSEKITPKLITAWLHNEGLIVAFTLGLSVGTSIMAIGHWLTQ